MDTQRVRGVESASTPGDRFLVLLSTAAFVVFPFFPKSQLGWFAVGFVGLALAGFTRDSVPLRASASLGALLMLSILAFGMELWPAPLIVTLGVFLAIARVRPGWFRVDTWLRPGTLSGRVPLWMLGAVVVSGSALVGWFELARPDYAAVRARMFPDLPAWQLLLGILGFSCCNAAGEEAAYRGVLQRSLEAAAPGHPAWAVGLQALAFGCLHIEGFPRGVAGVVLATVYGVMMALVRLRSAGLLAPWLAHVSADVVIGALLLTRAGA